MSSWAGRQPYEISVANHHRSPAGGWTRTRTSELQQCAGAAVSHRARLRPRRAGSEDCRTCPSLLNRPCIEMATAGGSSYTFCFGYIFAAGDLVAVGASGRTWRRDGVACIVKARCLSRGDGAGFDDARLRQRATRSRAREPGVSRGKASEQAGFGRTGRPGGS